MYINLQVKRYVDDPLIWHGAMKASWGVAMLNSIESFRQDVGRITLPLLLTHGTSDHLVPISSSQFIYNNVGSQDKRFEVRACTNIQHAHVVRGSIKLWHCFSFS